MEVMLATLSPDDILQLGKAVGTSSNQVILGTLIVVTMICVVFLGLVIVRLHRENKVMLMQFIERLEVKDREMTQERIARIHSLMELIREDSTVKRDLHNVMTNNTQAIKDLREFIAERLGKRP